ncbi:hypothetical protein Tph_c28460 [Thermacetogenium phaeum DSM 12270]|uniref:Uncharacterized protein n=2 Tax=Thermacetogenium phaeum TaxID=85874 RepID=K4LJ38_THEPS|nr:hypothetical protein [Thermacetogenium phaeum]MDK2881635.1 hypothetical protein [Clostridia bacterium]MDN5366189.1 hypothetical protein [Thermacetogenium sp.]AFV13011.1 hypothetical protein Tph_c28460 [Thermacetogenium phaeum DSM 12270]KUK36005.1 MAG: Uncharacterized protein XD66_1283 [Thermacetogenium phaeum]MDN5376231.1 hypothetical protein [Thermacetogenium sp.]
MSQEKGFPAEREESLFSLMARALDCLDGSKVELPGMVAVLSLFSLMNILSLVQAQQVFPGLRGAGTGGDLVGMLSALLAGGGGPGPEALLNLLQKSGKKLNPQLITALLSLAGEVAKKEGVQTETARSKEEPEPGKRTVKGGF